MTLVQKENLKKILKDIAEVVSFSFYIPFII